MGRIFALLAVLAIAMIIVVGGGIYWLAADKIRDSKQQVTTAIAKGIALSVTSKIDQLNRTLDQFGQHPELIAAVTGGNHEQLEQTLNRLQKLLPGAMKLRFLVPETNVLDKSEVPHMGYADIDLVRQTFQQNYPPKIQGETGPNRHLAIARKIIINDQLNGVLLASMNYDFLKKSVIAANLHQGLIQLKQDQLIMESTGDKKTPQQSDFDPIKVAGTDWVIQYWVDDHQNLIDSGLLLSLFLVPCLIILLAFFIATRKTSMLLRSDQSSILQAVKDMTEGRSQGHYPVFLDELKIVISSIMQYRRALNDNKLQASFQDQEHDLNLDDLFDEVSEDPNLEIMQNISNQKAVFNIAGDNEANTLDRSETKDKPVVLPETANSVSKAFVIPEIRLDNLEDNSIIFRAYDIRGIVGKSLTKEVVHDIGRAFGSEAQLKGCKTVLIGRDGRNSSPVLSETLAQGILSTGLNVIDLGMVPTPVLYFAAHHHENHTGIMLTGSHNPANYNGMKMILTGEVLSGERIQTLRQRIDDQNFVSAEQPGNLSSNQLLSNEYIGAVCEDIHLARPMKIVIDCGNGVAGELAPMLLKTLGCDVIELYCDIDGNFPNHHPDPSKPENLRDLSAAVKHYRADLGMAFDGDGDRLGIIDSQCKIIWPDRQMMLFAKDVLKSHPGGEIIFDVKCSRHLADEISKYGGKPLMYKTGHSLIKTKLKETGAKLAGEMSGHIFFNDRWFGFDDALYSAARIIEILSTDSRNSCEVFAEFPDSVNTPELNVALTEGENAELIDNLISSANFADGKICTIDGLRVDFADGWGLVRASNTTPSLVIRFEADSQEALLKIQEQFKKHLLLVKPDIQLPF